jgi:hypothetical protein
LRCFPATVLQKRAAESRCTKWKQIVEYKICDISLYLS